ncbi:MAG: hypothetical protein OCD76_02570 [Reichenbachiella sp.]
MRTRICLYISLFVSMVFSSCQEDVAPSELLVFLSPEDIVIEGNSGEHVLIQFDAISNNSLLSKMVIQQSDDYFGLSTLLDSSLETSSIRYILDYVIPDYPDSTVALLTFGVLNQNNTESRIAKKVLVNKGASSLTETSGHVVFSQQSKSPSAFELSTVTPVYLADTLTRQLDFMDLTTEEQGDVLSREWGSKTELSFVQFNSFNYASASAVSIKSAYDTGSKSSKVTNVVDGDIYLIGRGDQPFGAIQIIVVSDVEGADNDKYVFSIKLIDNTDFEYLDPNAPIEEVVE